MTSDKKESRYKQHIYTKCLGGHKLLFTIECLIAPSPPRRGTFTGGQSLQLEARVILESEDDYLN